MVSAHYPGRMPCQKQYSISRMKKSHFAVSSGMTFCKSGYKKSLHFLVGIKFEKAELSQASAVGII